MNDRSERMAKESAKVVMPTITLEKETVDN